MRPNELRDTPTASAYFRLREATLLAHGAYSSTGRSDNRVERIYLYRSERGEYFQVDVAKRDQVPNGVTPLSLKEAYDLYQFLLAHDLEEDEAFPMEGMPDA